MKTQRLVGRLELSRRLTGATKSTVYRQCGEGGRLHAAMVGDKIDLEHKNARIYCAEFGYTEPDMVAERAKASKAATTKANNAPRYDISAPAHDTLPPDRYEDDDPDATGFMRLSLQEIVKRYGKQPQFKEYVAAYKILVQTQAAEEKMARDRKEYAHFSHLERLAMHIDGLHKMLLTDAAKNIADTAKTLTAAGASDVAVRKAVTKVLEQVIKMTKSNSERIIRNAKS
jgi:hypothetical protein